MTDVFFSLKLVSRASLAARGNLLAPLSIKGTQFHNQPQKSQGSVDLSWHSPEGGWSFFPRLK